MSTSEIPRLMRRPPGFHLNFVRTIYTADETALAKQTAPALLHVQRSAPEKETLFGICATCSLVTTRSDQPSSSPDNRSHSPSSEDPPTGGTLCASSNPYTTPFDQVTSLALSPKSLVFAEFANPRTDTTDTTPSPVPRYTEDKLSGNQSYCPIVC
ncbi:hypothetical protein BDP67DRAFT_563398 [Colletotrichum lupini]|nr:hypothetical protein BDP67DRAFT_563398 [Colletotrichum lupini]